MDRADYYAPRLAAKTGNGALRRIEGGEKLEKA
jgi:hypothetical protein